MKIGELGWVAVRDREICSSPEGLIISDDLEVLKDDLEAWGIKDAEIRKIRIIAEYDERRTNDC